MVEGAARRRHRGDPRRGVQPHRGGQPPRPRRSRCKGIDNRSYYRLVPRQPALLHGLHRLRQHAEHAPSRRCCSWSWTACGTGCTEMHVDGFRFDLASSARRAVTHEVDRLGLVLRHHPSGSGPLAQVKLIAEPWDVGDGRLPGRQLPGPLDASGTAGTATACAASGRAIGGARPSSAIGSPARAICTRPSGRRPSREHQLRDGARRLHAERPRLATNDKHNEANGEEQPRRHERQPQLQLRRRGPVQRSRRSSRCAAARSATSSRRSLLSQGVPMIIAGDEIGPHAARQQQRLLPGQRALLARLGPRRAAEAALRVHLPPHRPAPQPACAAPADVLLGRLRARERAQGHRVVPPRRRRDDAGGLDPPERAGGRLPARGRRPLGAQSARPSRSPAIRCSCLINANHSPLEFVLPAIEFGERWEVLIDTRTAGEPARTVARGGQGRALPARRPVRGGAAAPGAQGEEEGQAGEGAAGGSCPDAVRLAEVVRAGIQAREGYHGTLCATPAPTIGGGCGGVFGVYNKYSSAAPRAAAAWANRRTCAEEDRVFAVQRHRAFAIRRGHVVTPLRSLSHGRIDSVRETVAARRSPACWQPPSLGRPPDSRRDAARRHDAGRAACAARSSCSGRRRAETSARRAPSGPRRGGAVPARASARPGRDGRVWARTTASGASMLRSSSCVLPRQNLAIDAMERFRFEAQVAAQLGRKTDFIVTVHDAGEDAEGRPVPRHGVRMRGRSLRQLIHERGPVPAAELAGAPPSRSERRSRWRTASGSCTATSSRRTSCSARAATGACGPRSPTSGSPSGSAGIWRPTSPRQTAEGVVLGTPGYLSPEHTCDGHADPQLDMWALAVVAHVALTGQQPFAGRTIADVLSSILEGARPAVDAVPGAPPELETWLRARSRWIRRSDPLHRADDLPRLRGRGRPASEAATAPAPAAPAAADP